LSDRLQRFTESEAKAYLTVTIRRDILRKARGPVMNTLVTEYECKRTDWLATFVVDVLDDAPPEIGDYLRARLFKVGTARPAVRRAAAEWLLDQIAESTR
jgi:hypothetical protein